MIIIEWIEINDTEWGADWRESNNNLNASDTLVTFDVQTKHTNDVIFKQLFWAVLNLQYDQEKSAVVNFTRSSESDFRPNFWLECIRTNKTLIKL